MLSSYHQCAGLTVLYLDAGVSRRRSRERLQQLNCKFALSLDARLARYLNVAARQKLCATRQGHYEGPDLWSRIVENSRDRKDAWNFGIHQLASLV